MQAEARAIKSIYSVDSKPSNMKLLKVILLLSSIFVCFNAENDTLQLVQIVFRHGDRTPTATFKTDIHRNWSDGWGQLTKIGKHQMYTLGLQLKNKYSPFISSYSSQNTYVRSSYADRCLMSAQLVLAGLFPPKGQEIWNPDLLWQPIPVHYLPRNMDNMIAGKKPCLIYDEALQDAYKSGRIIAIQRENQDLYDYLSSNAGEEIRNVTAVENIYNSLMIERLHNLPLPEWSKSLPLYKMQNLAAESLAIFTNTMVLQRFRAGPLFKNIINNMFKKVNGSSLDLILYSGHDVTLITLMRTMGFGDLLLPMYGAHLVFELHKISDNYEIRVLYGKDFSSGAKPLNLPFCQSSCLLNQFVSKLKNVIPVNWERECSGKLL